MWFIECKSLLPSDKCISGTQFQKKGLQIIDNTCFQITFWILGFFLQSQKFQHIGIFDQIRWRFYDLTFLRQLFDGIFFCTEHKTLVKRGIKLTLKFFQAPVIFHAFNFIKMAFIHIIHSHELQIVRPAQKEFSPCTDCRKILELVRQCLTNLIFRIYRIELPHLFQICSGKTFPKFFRQKIG